MEEGYIDTVLEDARLNTLSEHVLVPALPSPTSGESEVLQLDCVSHHHLPHLHQHLHHPPPGTVVALTQPPREHLTLTALWVVVLLFNLPQLVVLYSQFDAQQVPVDWLKLIGEVLQ